MVFVQLHIGLLTGASQIKICETYSNHAGVYCLPVEVVSSPWELMESMAMDLKVMISDFFNTDIAMATRLNFQHGDTSSKKW